MLMTTSVKSHLLFFCLQPVSNTIAEFQPIIQQSRQRFPCLQGTYFHGNPGVVARVPRQPFHMPSPFLLNSVRMPVPAYLDGSVGRSPAPWNVHW